MKKFYAILCLAIASLTQLQAQAPQGFNYQATVRNSSGDLIVNTNVYFKFNVIQGSQTAVPIFTETHYVPTDDLGQVNLVIGQGTANTGVFSEIDWSLGSYYLGIELDTGNGYVAMGTTQLLSVPYALYAENSGNTAPTTLNLQSVLAENNSANNQQIKDLQDPTEAQDAVTKNYAETQFYSQSEVDALITSAVSSLQSQLDIDGDGFSENQGDCDDSDASINPAEAEIEEDGIDNDCDGEIDENEPVVDQNGNSYDYLTYGDQAWTVENAEMESYRDGTDIPQVIHDEEWRNLTTGAWAYYDNDPTKPRLYNWYAVMGIHDNDPNTPNKEFAPEGWHVPTDAEWTTLEDYLIANGHNYDGTTTGNKIAKAMSSTTGWNSSTETGAIGNDQSLNNSSDFNAVPEGYRVNYGQFEDEGDIAIFWSSTENGPNNSFLRQLKLTRIDLNKQSFFGKRVGLSVRFVRGEAVNPNDVDDDADGYTENDGDCDDLDASINPGATEIEDDIDNDCDGEVDEGFDIDGDGYSVGQGDCDDSDASINPGATEIEDDIDNDCDGEVDEGFDIDGDGYSVGQGDCDDSDASINPGATEIEDDIDNDCDGEVDEGFDIDGDGYSVGQGDCDDSDASINPGATEIEDDIDNDCDGEVDEGFDIDGDGYSVGQGDCDDSDASINPGATEIEDDIDNDCDGEVDEGFDIDGDGYSVGQGDCDDSDASINPGATEIEDDIDNDCDGEVDEGFDIDGDGYSVGQGDCDDSDASINPGATEIEDDIDNDCDGEVDEGFDIDGDGYSVGQGDCDDSDASINPGATEIEDDIDNDCDGEVDEGFDIDGDGYSVGQGDCDDSDASINPGATEIEDDIDNDCDGEIDEFVVDQNGNSYDYLTYGDQAWTVENAEMESYRDGTDIPQVIHDEEWRNLTTGAWAYYDNDPTKPRLYNWYAVMGIHDNDPNTPNKEFAPEGWHVPTDAEWTTLEDYLIANGHNYDGTTTGNKIAKAMSSTTGWNSSTETGAIGNDQSLNNSSDFNAFPEVNRYGDGSFFSEGYFAFFWSSTEYSADLAFNRYLANSVSYLFRNAYGKRYGFSVRFVRD